MSRKGENIYKRKDGRWEGRYIQGRTLDNKAHYGYVYGKTYRDVKTKLSQKQSGISTAVSQEKPQDIRFLDVAQHWTDANRIFHKESTQIRYCNLLDSYILPVFGEMKINHISDNTITAFRNELLETGGKKKTGLSSKTVSDVLSLMKNILQYASSKGYSVQLYMGSFSVKQSHTQLRILSLQEQKGLCLYLQSNLILSNLGILLCLFTGIRIGELCALKWVDISIPEKTIYIHQTMQRIQTQDDAKKTKILISTPKSSCSIRLIPLPECLVSALETYECSPEAFFLTGKENEYIEPRTMQNRFKGILKDCKINSANFHALRHTFATRSIEVGFDIKSLSEILGHANVNITLNRYVHPTMNLKRDNMSKLNSLYAVK